MTRQGGLARLLFPRSRSLVVTTSVRPSGSPESLRAPPDADLLEIPNGAHGVDRSRPAIFNEAERRS